jgi:predicted SAM-dependent methyltransferase
MKVLAFSGAENVSRYWPDAEVVSDNPPKPGEYDGVYFEHLLQQLPRKDALPAMLLLWQSLKPGGEVIIVTTDLQWACREIANKDNPAKEAYLAVYGDDNEPYQSGFTLNWLRNLCEEAGFFTDTAYAVNHRAMVSGEEVNVQALVYTGKKPKGNPAEAIG